MKDMVRKRGLEAAFEIASAATSREEIGNPVYPPAQRKLAEHGIGCAGHHARQMTKYDYGYYDLIVCMDRANIRNARRIIGGDPQAKLRLLLDFTERAGEEVADPWYTGDFDSTWRDVTDGCAALIDVCLKGQDSLALHTEQQIMINKVPTTRERYLALVEAMGTQHKAGSKEATDDLDRLEELIGPAFGFYQTSRYKAARMITESLPAGVARDDRLQKLEEERAGQEITAADARKEMNELAQKYGTPDVFLADTSSEILSAELVSQFFSQR